MLTFSTQNTLSLEPKSPLGMPACSTIYFLLTFPLLQVYARTKQYLLCKTKPISGGIIMTVTSALTSTYERKPPPEAPKNKANSKPIGKKAATLAKLHQIRATSSDLLSSVPIRRLWPGFLSCRPPRAHKTIPFMQNKANLLNAQMNVTTVITKDYENKPPWKRQKTKPIPEKAKNEPNRLCSIGLRKNFHRPRPIAVDMPA